MDEKTSEKSTMHTLAIACNTIRIIFIILCCPTHYSRVCIKGKLEEVTLLLYY